jgi:hypothetical protein
MFVAADTQHQWTGLVVIFSERFNTGFTLGLCRLLGLFLLLLLRGGGGIFDQWRGIIEWR